MKKWGSKYKMTYIRPHIYKQTNIKHSQFHYFKLFTGEANEWSKQDSITGGQWKIRYMFDKCMDCMYAPWTHELFFFSPKCSFLGLPLVSSGTAAVIKPFFRVRLKTVQNFLRNDFFFKSQKVVANGYYGWHWKPFTRRKLKTSSFFKSS